MLHYVHGVPDFVIGHDIVLWQLLCDAFVLAMVADFACIATCR